MRSTILDERDLNVIFVSEVTIPDMTGRSSPGRLATTPELEPVNRDPNSRTVIRSPAR